MATVGEQKTFSWLIEVGISESREVGRVPPMEKAIWEAVCVAIFRDNARLILMTDGAACYQLNYRDSCPAVLEHYRVNHSEHEWTRPEPHVMWDPAKRETRFCLAGTQYLDSTWRRLKMLIPKGLCLRNHGDRVTKALYVRAQQWRLMTEGTDRWEEFMKAMRSYYSEDPDERAQVDGTDVAHTSDDERRATFLQRELKARTDEDCKVASLVHAAREQPAQD